MTDDWQQRATTFRYETRVGYTSTNGPRAREPSAAFFDRRIELLGGPTLRYTVKFSRTWWRHLGRVMLYCVLAEYHRQAGTTRPIAVPDGRLFAVITGQTS